MSVNIKTAMEQAMEKVLAVAAEAEVTTTPEVLEVTEAIIKVQPQEQIMGTPILSLDIPVNEASVSPETSAEDTVSRSGGYDTDFTFSRVEIDWSLFGKSKTGKESTPTAEEEAVEDTGTCTSGYDTDFTFSRVEIEVKEAVAA